MNKNKIAFTKRLVFGVFVFALLGYITTTIIPTALSGIELGIISPLHIWIISQILVGVLIGIFYPAEWWFMSICTAFFVFIHVSIDIAMNFSTRNLWPIEIFLSFVTILPAMLGAYIVMLFRSRN